MEAGDAERPLGTEAHQWMQNWSVDQVCQWLTSLERDPEVVEEFRRQKICGLALTKLEEKHFERMSSVMIGDQLIIIDKRNEILVKEEAETALLNNACTAEQSVSLKQETQTLQHKSTNISLRQGLDVSNLTTKGEGQGPSVENNEQQDIDKIQESAKQINSNKTQNQSISQIQSEEVEVNVTKVLLGFHGLKPSRVVDPTLSVDVTAGLSLYSQETEPDHKQEETKKDLIVSNTETSSQDVSGTSLDHFLEKESLDETVNITAAKRTAEFKENLLQCTESVGDEELKDYAEECTLTHADSNTEYISVSNTALTLESKTYSLEQECCVGPVNEKEQEHMYGSSTVKELQNKDTISESPQSVEQCVLELPVHTSQAMLGSLRNTLTTSVDKWHTPVEPVEPVEPVGVIMHPLGSGDKDRASEFTLCRTLQTDHVVARENLKSRFEDKEELKVEGIRRKLENVSTSGSHDDHQNVSELSGLSRFELEKEVKQHSKSCNKELVQLEKGMILSESQEPLGEPGKIDPLDEPGTMETCPMKDFNLIDTLQNEAHVHITEFGKEMPESGRIPALAPSIASLQDKTDSPDPMMPRRFKTTKELLEFKKKQRQLQSISLLGNGVSVETKGNESLVKKSFGSIQQNVSGSDFQIPEENSSFIEEHKTQRTVLSQNSNIQICQNSPDWSNNGKGENINLVKDKVIQPITTRHEATLPSGKHEPHDVKGASEVLLIESELKSSADSKTLVKEAAANIVDDQNSQSSDIHSLKLGQKRKVDAVYLEKTALLPNDEQSQENLQKQTSRNKSASNMPSHFPSHPEPLKDEKETRLSVKLIGKKVPQNICNERVISAITAREAVENNPKLSEVLRTIGTPADITFKYRKGAKISSSEGSSRSLLHSVHRFVEISDLNGITSLSEFSREVLSFTCGCLNDRRNGIIHFGIGSGKPESDAKYGEIIGVLLNSETKQYADFLNKAIRKCFPETQLEAVSQCISGPVFIETLSAATFQDAVLFVIEVDVIPKHKFCREDIFVVKLPKEQKNSFEPEAIFRIIAGETKKLLPNDEIDFREKVILFAAERKELEEQSRLRQRIENDLCKKFIHLFCHGEEALIGDHYQILVINQLDEDIDRDCIAETLSFIAEIEWKVVFDFDASAKLCNFVQDQEKPVLINNTDDFNPRSKRNVQEPDRLKQMLDELKNSECTMWCFANGYEAQEEPSLTPRQWKKTRAEGFKETVRFFHSQIPPGRAMVTFLLLSKETEVMLEAADVLMTVFDDQWMCLAEGEEIGKPWIEELIRRNCVEQDNFENKVVWGMPWKHVQETVNRILGPKKYSACVLPASTGALIPVNNKISSELTDLQILSSRECENAEILFVEEKLNQHRRQVEEEFYKGNSVSWWNFWFHHVCGRDILEPAKKQVRRALNSEDDAVGKVFLYHQPGAGGTTVAKNILWDFRQEYRCAIVHKISDGQTAQQVLKLFWYEDTDPKPVLLLLDNPDADKLNLLYADLSEMTRRMVKNNNEPPKVVCVFLVCSHFHTRTVEVDHKKLLLKHELLQRELNWFKERYKYLKSEYLRKENLDIRPPNAVDPRLLISFNVMKENFNQDYIRRTVRELLHNVTDSKERKLLKYVSLLNSFDLECRPVPTASLDGMMLEIPWLNQGGLRYGPKAKSNRWETKLSAEVRVLLNETSETAMGKIHSLRIANPLLSREILFVLRNNGTIPVGEIALEFFSSKEIFSYLCLPRDNLVNIIKDLLKRRQQKGGKPEKPFSPLIQHIVDKESIPTAVDVMKQVLSLTADPYIEQQLARLYIRAQNWDQAIEYAKKATDQRPENSFFWDTYGRIYEKQLVEEYDKLAKDTLPHSVNDLVHVIRIALDGMKVFRKVQETSEQEKTTILANKAGFFGELQMVACLLDCLTYVFRDVEDLRKFILSPQYVPPNCMMLKDVEGCNYLEELKALEKHVQQAMNRLEDELIQLRDDTLYEYQRTKYSKYEIDSLLRLKEHLDIYFGEENDIAPDNLSEKDQCDFRRRRLFRLASRNIGGIFDLRWKEDGTESLERIQHIAMQNLQTPHANAEDYLIMICVNLALLSVDISSLYNSHIRFDDMVKWSNELYRLRGTFLVVRLEPYLFFIMFNWPRKNTKHAVAPKLIETALRQWKDAYYAKYPRQQEEGKPYRKKDTTMFFLANGSDLASIYTTYEEIGSRRLNENRGRDSFWRMPDTLRKLQRFDGVLSRDGNEVSVYLHYEQGNKAPITIPTSLPIQNRKMWNKKVFFVIGFSWNGPRAFDVTLTDPTLETDMACDHTVFKTSAQLSFTYTWRRPAHDYNQEDFTRKFSKVREELERIRKIEEKQKVDLMYRLSPDEIELLGKKKGLEKTRDLLLEDRKRDMAFRIPDFTTFAAK